MNRVGSIAYFHTQLSIATTTPSLNLEHANNSASICACTYPRRAIPSQEDVAISKS